MIYTTSFKTQEEVRNYKSLDAYKYFTAGWVLETSWKLYGNVFLLVGKVNHSYAVNQTPLKPWVAIRKNGMVECGHCDCMAGLAETCSHVAAILYWLETAVRLHEETTCTSKTNSWLPPSMPAACHQVPYVTMEVLEQISSHKKLSSNSGSVSTNTVGQAPSQEELEELYMDLSKVSDRKPAILTLISPYSDRFIQSSDHLPPLLQDLYDPKNLILSYDQLVKKYNVFKDSVTESQVQHLEEITRGQTKNRQWFRYRTGRITASQLYQVCFQFI